MSIAVLIGLYLGWCMLKVKSNHRGFILLVILIFLSSLGALVLRELQVTRLQMHMVIYWQKRWHDTRMRQK